MPQHVRISKRAPIFTWASSPGHSFKDPRPMSNKEFRAICKHLKINHCIAAEEALGISHRTAQRYWYKEIDVPGPLARLLRLAKKQKLTHKDLLAL